MKADGCTKIYLVVREGRDLKKDLGILSRKGAKVY